MSLISNSIVAAPEPNVPRSFSGGVGRSQHRLRAFHEAEDRSASENPYTSTARPISAQKKENAPKSIEKVDRIHEEGEMVTTSTTEKPNKQQTDEDDTSGKMVKTKNIAPSSISISTVWEGMKRMMGFAPDCHNGGYKTISGDCICPQFYEGKACERIVCAHNGTRVRVAAFGGEEVCKCSHPEYISGKHCELVHCQNGGRLLNDGTCHCVDGWYMGQFCQYYTSSWLIAIGVPLLAITAIILCCVVCRLDLCALRRASPSSSGRRHRERRSQGRRRGGGTSGGGYGSPERRCRQATGEGNCQRREHTPFRHIDEEMMRDQNFYIQQNLLDGRLQQPQQGGYVLRLEQIPVYNPRLYVPVDPNKPLEPPPPYDLAILCPTHHDHPPTYRPDPDVNNSGPVGLQNSERNEREGSDDTESDAERTAATT